MHVNSIFDCKVISTSQLSILIKFICNKFPNSSISISSVHRTMVHSNASNRKLHKLCLENNIMFITPHTLHRHAVLQRKVCVEIRYIVLSYEVVYLLRILNTLKEINSLYRAYLTTVIEQSFHSNTTVASNLNAKPQSTPPHPLPWKFKVMAYRFLL